MKPYLRLRFQKIAPREDLVDNLQNKFEEHFGKVYKDNIEYTSLIEEDCKAKPWGDRLGEEKIGNFLTETHIISAEVKEFHECAHNY